MAFFDKLNQVAKNLGDKTSDAIDRNIKEISNALNLKGWFYGHAHEDDYIDDKMLGNHKVLHARSQSLMLENGQHCEESRNGFNLFKLTRNEGKVTNISYYDEVNKRVQDFPNLFKEN